MVGAFAEFERSMIKRRQAEGIALAKERGVYKGRQRSVTDEQIQEVRSMIDMGAVLGGRAIVGNRCHIGAGTVLAGVVEPASATPVVIEDDVMIGANAVVIEGVRVGRGAVVGAGAIVIKDVPAGAVVVGNPARIIKMKDEKTEAKTALIDALRTLD